jgi:hypothetical protein
MEVSHNGYERGIVDDQTIPRFDGWLVSRFYGDFLIAI